MNYETIIGLEVHVQLLTDSKMFCGCKTAFGADPNTQTCPVCLGLPGVLPVPNQKAVELAVRMALAVQGKIRTKSIFARKNYFYPDLPKGYQISQYEEPFCENGHLEIETENHTTKSIRIRRIHLEEDAGKSVHAEEYVTENQSFLDFNRCGVPLIEIVTEPDLSSPQEAVRFLVKLRHLVRWLGISDGNMEEGSLRCDANVSIRPQGERALGVKTELKNMNSFRAVEQALECEILRQKKILDSGGKIVQQTLLWDESTQNVFPMREKEEAHDYRYFPDPDLPPLRISESWIQEIQKDLPELPEARKARWADVYHLSPSQISVLIEDRGIADYFEALVSLIGDPQTSANWVMGEVLRVLNQSKISISELKVKPQELASLLQMIQKGEVSLSAGKKVFEAMTKTGEKAEHAVRRLGLVQISDEGVIQSFVDQVLAHHSQDVHRYWAGNEKLFGFFMGEVMKLAKGKANPQVVHRILKRRLEEMKG